jgi:hypothetical protein
MYVKKDGFNNTISVQGGSNMTGTNCDFFTHKQSRSYLNHLVQYILHDFIPYNGSVTDSANPVCGQWIGHSKLSFAVM